MLDMDFHILTILTFILVLLQKLYLSIHAHKLKDFRKHEIDLIMLKRKQIIINTPNLGKIAQSKKPINPISKH
ncbi:MAG: hypothetical protein MSA18_08910, partial [Succinivibrio sp.]|nr:hypothetical protein [Succinivibrio sp.]